MTHGQRRRATSLLAAALVGLAGLGGLVGCTDGATGAPTTGAAVATTASIPSATPLIDEDFPDPDVTRDGDRWRAFATGTAGLNVRTATSPDLISWTVERRDALPALPAWASTGRTWAPDVSRRADGTWVMYVTAQDTESGRQCIGVATSTSAGGTFAPAADKPLVCPVDQGGAIDPSTFTDSDGSRYLLWKTDGNCCGLDTWIEIARLSDDGLRLVGKTSRLIKQTLPWEGNLVEAPVLVRHGDEYVLLYSANDYGGDGYAVGAARSAHLLGPYAKQADPVLSTVGSGGRWRGPGGQDVVATDDGDIVLFHAWDELYTYRSLNDAPLVWGADGTVSVGS